MEMTLKEFMDLGYLQELNRQFLHPLGLSMAFRVEGDGVVGFHVIYDHRDDKAGVVFKPNKMVRGRAEFIEKEQNDRGIERLEQHGFIVQPLD